MNEGHEELCSSDAWAEYLATEVLPRVIGDTDLGDHLLEVGPGFGKATDVLRSKATRITAVDADEGYAEALAQRFRGSNVTVETGDATALRFDDATFSSAASFTMLHHVPTAELQDALVREVARVLRPGGVFLGSDSLDGEGFRSFHEGDICNPVDADTFAMRLRDAGFAEATVTAEWTAPADEQEAFGTVFFVGRR